MMILDGRYRLVEQRGRGGMAVVWLAHDEILGRDVAVKLLAARLAEDPAARDRIRAEARAAGRLAHPNITSVYDFGVAAGPDGDQVPYVVMELLDGRTLAHRMRSGPMAWRRVLSVCADIAAALAAAHEAGVVHRDVKPANVMLTSRGVKVLDFGIAAEVGGADEDLDEPFLGTLAYIAPERLLGGSAVPATDVYALGLIAYRALAEDFPWRPESTEDLVRHHCFVEPAPLPPVDGLPTVAADLIERCLAKDPADRPSSVEVAAVFGQAAGHRVLLPGQGADRTGDLTAPVPGTWDTGESSVDTVAPRSPVPIHAAESGPSRNRAPIGRLALAGLGLAGVLAFAVTCAARTPQVNAGAPASSTPPGVLDGGLACAVTYQPTGVASEVRVTVHSTGGADFDAPTLVFDLTEPEVPPAGEPTAHTRLLARVANHLPAGQSVTVRLRSGILAGRMASGFALNGVSCQVSSTAPEPGATPSPGEREVPVTVAPTGLASPGPIGSRATPSTSTPGQQPTQPVPTTRRTATHPTGPAVTTGPRTPVVPTPTRTKKTKCPPAGPQATCSP